ncbi:peptidase M75 [Pyxidicoccus fallax]|uniref:Peptidase M75 n=1 Tax=Pyxidicoccus fallax TaxID=394095 RepID=A0A848LRC6_9BACT|nr:imelysin family protein [Pyxidicoccus fallax]NMO20190.1 peptidase M75 [Pyxidicoccus fallax]NPC82109.1 peptidase M75 [Pyxidicoccus fallax]
MKRFSVRLLLAPVFLSGALMLSACPSAVCCDLPPEPILKQELLTNFADAVAVPTYERLATRLDALDAAARALRSEPTEARLAAARQAWLAAREPWARSEAFLFGPADSDGHASALDSWPVDRAALDGVFANDGVLTAESVRGLPATQRGFHAVEYVLFGEDGARAAESLTPRELEYLTLVTEEMKSVGAALTGAWTQTTAGQPPYRDTLAGTGLSADAIEPAVRVSAKRMVDGVIDLLDEVATAKLTAPYEAKDPSLLENQFARASVSDLVENLRGVESVYLGHAADVAVQGQTLRDVVGFGTDVDARVRGELTQALQALEKLPEPFPEALGAPASADEIEAARDAVRKVHGTFQRDVLPRVIP